jgi:hypothetical protein
LKAVGIVVLVVIVFFFGYMIYDSPEDDVIISGIDVKRLKTITETIECYSATQDFTCGQISFQTNSDVIIKETEVITIIEEKEIEVTDDAGNVSIEMQNVTTTKVVPKVSTADITYLDKQTGDFVVCKMGNQCVIEAQVELFDDRERSVPAPYGYQLTISCEHRDACNQDRTRSTSAGQVTEGDGSIRYTWVPTLQDSVGEYEILLNVRSAMLNSDGIPINLPKTISLVLIS